MGHPLSHAEDRAIQDRIDSQEELIVAVAIATPLGTVTLPRPARHGDLRSIIAATGYEFSEMLHGFITNHGRFVGRKEAALVVVASGQGSPREGEVNPHGHLFTEDLWNGWEGSQHPSDWPEKAP